MPSTPRRRGGASRRAHPLVRTAVSIRGWRLACGVLVTLATAGCSASGPPAGAFAGPPTPLVADPASYQSALAAGDVISIQFPYRPTFNQEVVVRTDGQINLPVIGTLPVVGRTPEAVQEEVRARYLRQTYDPATAGERVYLIGVGDKLSFTYPGARQFDLVAVVRPDGRVTLPLIGAVRVEGKSADSLAFVLSARYESHLLRSGVRVDIAEATSDRTYANGQIVHTAVRDVEEASVIVRSFAPRQVFVAGEVRAPGFVSFQPSLTALQAIVGAGGTLRTGQMGRVLVLRRTGVDTPTAMHLDLGSDMRGSRANDVALRPFDIVIVPKTRVARTYDFVDQYIYQLFPLSRNVNFTYFYDFRK